jgi:hypothetical protein
VRGPDQSESGGKTEQQIFDEQIARASGKAVVMVGGVGILASVVISTVALVISAGHHDRTVTVRAAAPAAQTATSPPKPPQLAGDTLDAQFFISGKPEVGAIGCGSCHTMKAAGASGTIGPNVVKELTADPPRPRASRSSTPTRRSSPDTAPT